MPTVLFAAKPVPVTGTEASGMRGPAVVMVTVYAFIVGMARAIRSVRATIALIFVLFDDFLKILSPTRGFSVQTLSVEIFNIY